VPDKTRKEVLADCNELFGFIPTADTTGELGRRKRDMEQTSVTNKIRDVMKRLADAQGEEARLLRILLERMRKTARLFGFRAEFE